MIHRVTERRIFPQKRKILNFNRFESTKVRGNTKINPIAFFSPIILVLSLTETNMILATPKPPTSKAKKAIKQPPRLILVKGSPPQGVRCTKMVLRWSLSIPKRTLYSRLLVVAWTAMMQNMPMAMPNKERKVLTLLCENSSRVSLRICHANDSIR